MEVIFAILVIIVSVFLMGIILIQNSKGGGLAANVGLSSQTLGGVKKATEGIEKLTWGLITALFVLCIGSGFFYNQNAQAENPEPKVKSIDEVPMVPNGAGNPQSPVSGIPQGQPASQPTK